MHERFLTKQQRHKKPFNTHTRAYTQTYISRDQCTFFPIICMCVCLYKVDYVQQPTSNLRGDTVCLHLYPWRNNRKKQKRGNVQMDKQHERVCLSGRDNIRQKAGDWLKGIKQRDTVHQIKCCLLVCVCVCVCLFTVY